MLQMGKTQGNRGDALGTAAAGSVKQRLFEAEQFAFAMMNNLSFGLFAIDHDDEIMWVNDTACRSVNIRRKALIHEPMIKFFPDWFRLKRILNSGLKFLDEERSFENVNTRERFLFNAYPINTEQNECLGYILSFRSFERAVKLAGKIQGLQAHFTFNDIVSCSPVTQHLIEFAHSVATTPSSVLITGESGCGKEVFAQAIHNASERRHRPFVAINCGAISANLIESELFGYEDGAFTGAKKGGKAGKFEVAQGGTLFLDEIGEMPLDMQVKLLRVLQENKFTRVGGNQEIDTDLRIIAATNRDLQDRVKENKFRLDLFYRLNVIQLKIPALRERPEDIPGLVHLFLLKKSAKLNKAIPFIDTEQMQLLQKANWPGNIRELENYVERLMILGEDDSALLTVEKPVPKKEGGAQPGVEPLWQLEKRSIEQGLILLNNNVSELARRLQISRNTLYQKMKKYQIDLG